MRFITHCAAALGAALLGFAGLANADTYLDATLGDVPAEDLVAISDPRPVQLIFQYAHNGRPSVRLSHTMRPMMIELLRARGIFSDISMDPVEGGATISITFDDTYDPRVLGQATMTGLTFGLVGATGVDTVLGTLEFTRGSEAPIVKTARHALYTTVGMSGLPPNTIPVQDAQVGIDILLHQLVAHLLNDLAKDPSFSNSATTAAADTSASGMGSSRAWASSRPDEARRALQHGQRLIWLATPQPTRANVRALREPDMPTFALGAFLPAPDATPGVDRAIRIRLVTIGPRSGSLARYLRDSLETELRAAGKLDEAARVQISGQITQSSIDSDRVVDERTRGFGVLGARFQVSRDGATVFDREIVVRREWPSAFQAVIAVPEALAGYEALYVDLVTTLLADPEFRAAVRPN